MTRKKNLKEKKIRILIADDHSIVREGLALYMNGKSDIEVVAEAEDVASGLDAVKASNPDVAIVDLSLGDTNGFDLIKDLKAGYPKLPILVFSMFDETRYARRVLKAGAMGYIMKQEDMEKVVEGIRQVFAGNIFVSKKVASMMLRKFVGEEDNVTESPADRLANRELEVFRMTGQGLITRTIAKKLHISPVTVRTHKAHIKEKLGLQSTKEFLQYAIQWVQEHGEV